MHSDVDSGVPYSYMCWTNLVSMETLNESTAPLDKYFMDDECFIGDDESSKSDNEDEDNVDYDDLPITEVILAIKVDGKEKLVYALLDSGTSYSLATENAIK